MQIFKPLSIAAGSVIAIVSAGAFAAQPTTIQPQPVPSAVQAPSSSVTTVQKKYTPAELDRDHNGQLTRSELPLDVHVLRRDFVRVDLDDNGQLSPQEILHYARGTAPQFVGVQHAFTVVNPYPEHRDEMELAALQ